MHAAPSGGEVSAAVNPGFDDSRRSSPRALRDYAAAHWFERRRSSWGSPGIFAEEFDVKQRQLRGNFPQAFVHALFIESAAGQRDDGHGSLW